jgi:hypothetical protein
VGRGRGQLECEDEGKESWRGLLRRALTTIECWKPRRSPCLQAMNDQCSCFTSPPDLVHFRWNGSDKKAIMRGESAPWMLSFFVFYDLLRFSTEIEQDPHNRSTLQLMYYF